MTLLDLVVLSLAVFRVARLVGWDKITQRWRSRLIGYTDQGNRNAWPANHRTIGELIQCPFCFSAYVGVAAWVCFRQWPHATMLIAWPLAIMAVAGLVGKNLDA